MSILVLVRHGTSEYNAKGMWTGWDNPPLNEDGILEAKRAGAALKDIYFDLGYTSALIRAQQTLDLIKQNSDQETLPVVSDQRLNERNYGIYTRKNKWEVKEDVGEEEFQKIRRGWDYPIPEGESLQQVYEREIPYFEEEIEPRLKEGKNIIIASSGNALRAIVKYLENIPDDKIADVEFGLGEAWVYNIDENGKVVSKEIKATNLQKGKI